MTYFPVQPRYSVYIDSLGDPLDDGYIYLGKANLDPTVYPAKASWDEAGLYPITFPVRTMNGYPLRDGVPAQMYLNFADNTEYSVLINDEDGVEVFSSTTGLIGYFPSTGAGGDADTLEGHPASYFAVDSLVAHLAGAETFTGIKTIGSSAYLAFSTTSEPKIYLDSNTHGIGIVGTSFIFWTSAAFTWRQGGTSPGSGTINMNLNSSGNLSVTGSVSAASLSATNGASGTIDTTATQTITVVDGIITSIV